MGWATANACWSIQQATTNWHGLGARAFAEVLPDWNNRYKGLETHHSEEFCYFDVCDGGFYTLTANVTAYKPRIIQHARISFQLVGIPLDSGPIRHLCHTFEVDEAVYFRPRQGRSVNRQWIPSQDRPTVTPVAFMVEEDEWEEDAEDQWDEQDPEDREWVRGIVVKNPYYPSRRTEKGRGPDWLPDMVADSEYLICELRSWHPLSSPMSTYRLWNCESAWTSDALVVRPVADWDDRG
jgi:hypothetical protein